MKERTPHPLFDTLIADNKLRNDSELAEQVELGRDVISRIRNQKMPMSDHVRIKIMRNCRISLQRLDELSPPEVSGRFKS